jgi:hypothetical protein
MYACFVFALSLFDVLYLEPSLLLLTKFTMPPNTQLTPFKKTSSFVTSPTAASSPMNKINADVRTAIQQLSSDDFREVGLVTSIGDGVAKIIGLSSIQAGELVRFESGIFGIVLNLEQDLVGVALFGQDDAVSEGDRAFRTQRTALAEDSNIFRTKISIFIDQFRLRIKEENAKVTRLEVLYMCLLLGLALLDALCLGPTPVIVETASTVSTAIAGSASEIIVSQEVAPQPLACTCPPEPWGVWAHPRVVGAYMTVMNGYFILVPPLAIIGLAMTGVPLLSVAAQHYYTILSVCLSTVLVLHGRSVRDFNDWAVQLSGPAAEYLAAVRACPIHGTGQEHKAVAATCVLLGLLAIRRRCWKAVLRR